MLMPGMSKSGLSRSILFSESPIDIGTMSPIAAQIQHSGLIWRFEMFASQFTKIGQQREIFDKQQHSMFFKRVQLTLRLLFAELLYLASELLTPR